MRSSNASRLTISLPSTLMAEIDQIVKDKNISKSEPFKKDI